ncbi:hypothetical protein DdX_17900 [Ditylenchus destructor]|uniref:Uncharacterized protein n=1 Tax=Ditylenchus destructor TaxID=166010 RepID=A0AAD4QYK5_9BILA|nr:hypothetical protein DdX_17900 [Ditylenchus destructor]
MLVISKNICSVTIVFVSIILLAYVGITVAPESATNSEAVEGSAPAGEKHIQIVDAGSGKKERSPTFKRYTKTANGWEARRVFGKDGVEKIREHNTDALAALKKEKKTGEGEGGR